MGEYYAWCALMFLILLLSLNFKYGKWNKCISLKECLQSRAKYIDMILNSLLVKSPNFELIGWPLFFILIQYKVLFVKFIIFYFYTNFLFTIFLFHTFFLTTHSFKSFVNVNVIHFKQPKRQFPFSLSGIFF